MAQLAFIKFDDIEQAGPTGVAQITFVFNLVWVGDELAGRDTIRVIEGRGVTNATLAADVQAVVIARAAALGRPGLTNSDIRLIGGAVF